MTLPPHRAPHILSVDVEDYFQVEAFSGVVRRDEWDCFPSRVVANTQRLLDLFEAAGARATFFFVGWVAERFPHLVRETVRRGHEVACHSYWHRLVYTLDRAEFEADTRRARETIEQAAGVRLLGYRAPSWSITRACPWARDVLAELGFVYDSSVYPIHHDLYGIPGSPRFRHLHTTAEGRRIWEIPPSTVHCLGLTLPAAGGGYLRLFPLRYSRWAIRRIAAEGQPAVVYLHPWEIDPDQPRIHGPWRSRFRQYTNLGVLANRLQALLNGFAFQPFAELLRDQAGLETHPATETLA